MRTPEIQWIRDGAGKMDRHLRHVCLSLYRPPRFAACFLSRPLYRLREHSRPVPVIIQLAEGAGAEERRRLMELLRGQGARRVRELPLINAVAAVTPASFLAVSLGMSSVRRLSYDREVRAYLDVAAPTVHAPQVWEEGNNGAGVTVAVVDTGIYPHDDFVRPRNRIVAFRDLVGGRTSPYDDNGHGTHVAGIAAGNGSASNGRYRGIAPEARLVGVKVLNSIGSGSLSTVIEGIQWVVENKDRCGIRVLSLSLGAPAGEPWDKDPAAQAVGAAWRAGLVVCVAAGNEGPEAGTISTPGIHPDVITVGASDDRNTTERDDDRVPDFSSRGPTVDGLAKPDLVAPGTGILACNSPNSTIAKQQGAKRAAYIELSGTSMATPVVAGIAALLLSARPSLTPDEVKDRLLAATTSLDLGTHTEGKGLVDAEAALRIDAPSLQKPYRTDHRKTGS